MKKLYICEDTITGMYSAIYDAWKENRNEGTNGIRLEGQYETELFCNYRTVATEKQKAVAVESLIKKNLGYEAYRAIYYALLSPEPDRADAVLAVMQTARTLKNPRQIMEYLGHEKVRRVFELSRSVANEAHYFVEFIRFRELNNGILFSEITPRSQVLTCVADHFADRFPLENWLIYDKSHQMYLVHEAKKRWVLVQGDLLNLEKINMISENEVQIVGLWRSFCKTISIKERENLKLQRNHLPLHYRGDMTEFQ